MVVTVRRARAKTEAILGHGGQGVEQRLETMDGPARVGPLGAGVALGSRGPLRGRHHGGSRPGHAGGLIVILAQERGERLAPWATRRHTRTGRGRPGRAPRSLTRCPSGRTERATVCRLRQARATAARLIYAPTVHSGERGSPDTLGRTPETPASAASAAMRSASGETAAASRCARSGRACPSCNAAVPARPARRCQPGLGAHVGGAWSPGPSRPTPARSPGGGPLASRARSRARRG